MLSAGDGERGGREIERERKRERERERGRERERERGGGEEESEYVRIHVTVVMHALSKSNCCKTGATCRTWLGFFPF